MDYIYVVKETMKNLGKPVSAGEVEKASGLDRKLVDKAFKELKESSVLKSAPIFKSAASISFCKVSK